MIKGGRKKKGHVKGGREVKRGRGLGDSGGRERKKERRAKNDKRDEKRGKKESEREEGAR